MRRASTLMISLGLVTASGVAALGQERVNPVTINPGAPSMGSAGSVILNLTPGYAFGTPWAYGGFPTVYGGGIVVSNGGWGYPATGFYGNGYGGLGFGPGSMSDSPWNDPVAREQRHALAASRYEMQNAQATEAYAKANYFQQKAIAAAIENAKAAPPPPIQERFNARTARTRGSRIAARVDPTLPLDKLVTRGGGVLWPAAAPKDDARDGFDAVMATLAKQFEDAGKADVKDVNAARDALQAYGVPALAKVRREKPAQAAAMKTFLNSLDATLVAWAK